MQDEQRTCRSHRERSRKITLQGWAWNYGRAAITLAIRIRRSTDPTQAKIEIALNPLPAIGSVMLGG
jgi:hypothetical protein